MPRNGTHMPAASSSARHAFSSDSAARTSLPDTSSAKTPLHPLVQGIVPRKENFRQIAYRWVTVSASCSLAVLVGQGLDFILHGYSLPFFWWLLAVLSVSVAGCAGALATAHSLRTQSHTERVFRELSQRACFTLGPLRIRERAGQILDLATNGAMRAARYRGGFLSATVASLTSPLIVCIAIAGTVGLIPALLMAALIIIGPILVRIFTHTTARTGQKFRESQMKLRQSFLQGINALESLVYAGAGDSYADSLAQENERHRIRIMKLLAGNQLLIFFMDIVFSLAAFVLVTVLSVRGISAGSLSVGQVLSFFILTVLLVAPVDLIGQFFYIGIGGRATQKQFSAFLYEADAVPRVARENVASAAGVSSQNQHDRPADFSSEPPAVFLQDVTVSWDEAPALLENVTWEIVEGQKVGLVGPSGIGKSTLSSLIQGYIQPTHGQVYIQGDDITTLTRRVLAQRIAVVEQRTYLLNDTIAENLRLASPQASDAELYEALDYANLGDEVRAFPHGLNTVIGDRGSCLSGGQAQRLAIARVFLTHAPLIILDEPTSQVDLSGEALIVNALQRVAHQRTVLMIAHRQSALADADRVYALSNRSLTEVDGAQS
ncbi:ATP-binding cassette domain-containing protein [Schaalia sp. lx-260]|uniref:ATP-binding cassette domain-containing protein n=1 Tax=Schaalia sp. lx-260 TaxID=2899082 RepID=UPI001E53291C|nr:ATP-binding cassette domain-containing protein [Schaalia sp. lx-260]MCD4549004.1 ATP-binding cassette domain-containing protein [Schaalia sp. lx-260]